MSEYKLDRFLELMEVMEQAVAHKLRLKKPLITQDEINEEISKWYLDRSKSPNGDADGERGDISRFLK